LLVLSPFLVTLLLADTETKLELLLKFFPDAQANVYSDYAFSVLPM